MQSVNNIDALGSTLDRFIKPFNDLLTKNQNCYQHLAFTGCGTISIGATNLGEILRTNYSGLFCKGFEVNEISNRGIQVAHDSRIFTRCLHDNNKLQINAISEQVLRQEAIKFHISDEETEKLVNLRNSFLMNSNEIKAFITKLRPFMEIVYDVWEGSFMQNLSLTSVGVAIAHANIKRKAGEFTDLSIWIN